MHIKFASAVCTAVSLAIPAPAPAKDIVVDTTQRSGVLTVAIHLKGSEAPQPHSLRPDGQPVRNAKGEPLAASLIQTVTYDRKIELRLPMQGFLGAQTGISQVDRPEGDRLAAKNQALAAQAGSGAAPPTERGAVEEMGRIVEKCNGNQACIADAARMFSEANKGRGASAPAMPGPMPRPQDLQRYLALSTRPDPASGKCGTATIVVNDHYAGRLMDAAAGWVNFDYYRQGRQDIPAVPAGAASGSKLFVDTATRPVSLCGSKLAFDRERNVYHLQLAGISARVLTVRADMPRFPPFHVEVLQDAEPKLVFLNNAGGGNTVSVAPMEIRNLYQVMGTQKQMVPLHATISWAFNMSGTSAR